MLVGAFHFPTDYGIEIGELARALEERGFESLFVAEHTQSARNPRDVLVDVVRLRPRKRRHEADAHRIEA